MSTTQDTPTPQPAQAANYEFVHGSTPFVFILRNGEGVGSIHKSAVQELAAALNRLPAVEAELKAARIEVGGLTADRNILVAKCDTLARRVEELTAQLEDVKEARAVAVSQVENVDANLAQLRLSLERKHSEAIATLRADNDALAGALEEIEKGEGKFSRDPLTHAANVIDNLTAIARAALAAHRAGGAK